MVRVMSIKLMTAVWEREDLSSTHKLVLLALADWANDEGLCWPSINRLAVKASLTTRAVQKSIRALEQVGFVRREEVTGKGNRYWISIPANDVHPCTTFTPPLNDVHPTPEPRSPNTSKTHQLNTNLIVDLAIDASQPALLEKEAEVSNDDSLKVSDVVEYWNEVAERIGKPKVQRLSDGRKQVIRARIKQNTVDDFVQVFQNIEASDFLRNWKAMGFDWVFKAGNFQKILEGNYND